MQSNHENHQYKQDFVHKKFNNLMRNYEKLREFGHHFLRKPFTIIAASPDHKTQVIISGKTMSDPSGNGSVIIKN